MLKRRTYLKFTGVLVVLGVIFFLGQESNLKTPRAINSSSPQIIEPEGTDPEISGFQNIKVYDSSAQSLDIYLLDGFESPISEPCYIIDRGLEFNQHEVIYNWDSSTVVDGEDYVLLVISYYEDGRTGTDSKILKKVTNGKTGEPCQEPFDPPLNPPPPSSGDTLSPSSGETDGTNESTTTQQPTTTPPEGKTTTVAKEATEETTKKEERKDALVVFDEEIPITLDRFDPDIFLKGGDVEIGEIKNITKDGNQHIRFSGRTKPSFLVTLYIFSSPVIVVVKSDLSGNWLYSREKPFDSGKHTVFATIYDEGVTRRSGTVDFFIAKGTKNDQSLILTEGNFQRFYPYIASLAGAIVLAILILVTYRIYSKRKSIRT